MESRQLPASRHSPIRLRVPLRLQRATLTYPKQPMPPRSLLLLTLLLSQAAIARILGTSLTLSELRFFIPTKTNDDACVLLLDGPLLRILPPTSSLVPLARAGLARP